VTAYEARVLSCSASAQVRQKREPICCSNSVKTWLNMLESCPRLLMLLHRVYQFCERFSETYCTVFFCCVKILIQPPKDCQRCGVKRLAGAHRRRSWGSLGQDPPNHAIRGVRLRTGPPNFWTKSDLCFLRHRFV
jgi:hypothetical protein